MKIYYLEMCDPSQLRPSQSNVQLDLALVSPPRPDTNRAMYVNVGQPWNWTDWLVWSDQQWHDFAVRDELRTWLAYVNDQTAGYFELESQPDGDIEIVHFGLVPEFIGQGLGGALLTLAVDQAWKIDGTKRVWLHTCEDDHPQALKNYQARGFQIYRVDGT